MSSLQTENANDREGVPLLPGNAGNGQNQGQNYGSNVGGGGNPDFGRNIIGLHNEKRRTTFMLFFDIVLLIFLIVCLSAFTSCSHALNWWMGLQLVFRAFDLNYRVAVLHWLRGQNEADFSISNLPMTLKVYNFFVEFCYLAIVIFGTTVYFTMNECSDEDVEDALILTLLIIGWIYYGVPLAALVLICICLPCIYFVMEYQDRNDPNRPHPATEEMIAALTRKNYDEQDGSFSSLRARDDNPSCSVCYNAFENGERLIKLNCDHYYHENCIIGWLKNNAICPICRKKIDS